MNKLSNNAKQTNSRQRSSWRQTENLAGTFDLWRRTRPLHSCHGGFEIPQTESALVQVLNAIDVVVKLETKSGAT